MGKFKLIWVTKCRRFCCLGRGSKTGFLTTNYKNEKESVRVVVNIYVNSESKRSVLNIFINANLLNRFYNETPRHWVGGQFRTFQGPRKQEHISQIVNWVKKKGDVGQFACLSERSFPSPRTKSILELFTSCLRNCLRATSAPSNFRPAHQTNSQWETSKPLPLPRPIGGPDDAGVVTDADTSEVEFAWWWTGGGVALAASVPPPLAVLLTQLRYSTTRLQSSAGPQR